jgi:hypothetical protein
MRLKQATRLTGSIFAAVVVIFSPSGGFGQSDSKLGVRMAKQILANEELYNTALRKLGDAQKRNDNDEAFRRAKEFSEIARQVLPVEESNREYAALMYMDEAALDHQPDDVIAQADANAVAEMNNHDDGDMYLTVAYSNAAIAFYSDHKGGIDERRDLSLTYARKAVEIASAYKRQPDMCGAAAVGVLAGEAYRQFNKAEGDRLTAVYRGAVNGHPCPEKDAWFPALEGFDALADGFMKMSPDRDSVKRTLDLALQVSALNAHLADYSDFFKGTRLVVHFLQLHGQKREIETAFQRALNSIPSMIDITKGQDGEIAVWLYIMRDAAQTASDSASVDRIGTLQSRLSTPPVARRSNREVNPSEAQRLLRRMTMAAEEEMRKKRKDLPASSPQRLVATAAYLGAAVSADEDPFKIRQAAEDAMKDIPTVWTSYPTEALQFEFEVSAAMSEVDGSDAHYTRASKALADARSLYGDSHPCIVKFMLESSAAAYAIHKNDEGDRLFDRAVSLYSSLNRCVETGTADSLALCASMYEVGWQLVSINGAPARTAKLIALGRELERDVLLTQEGGANARMQFEGIIPMGFAADQGDEKGLIDAIDAITAQMNDPSAATAEQHDCARIVPFIRVLTPDVLDEKAVALHCKIPALK